MGSNQTDFWVSFYGEYRHKDRNCEEMIGSTSWSPVEGGNLLKEARKVGEEPLERDRCPECWE